MDDWSVEVFDSFPDRPVYLTPGKRLPFDVAVADKDYNGASTAWVYWAPGSWNGGHIGGHLGTVVMGPSVLADAQIVDSLINTIVQRDLNTRLQATGARPVGRAAPASEGFAVAIVDGVIAVVIILSIGFAGFFILRGRSASSNKILEDLAGRVENVERRMTDTQEVMIALSEKYDLLEVR